VIAIVDTGGANLASVINAFARLGHTATLTGDPAEIARASHVILPGVGAAGDSMARLRRDGLVDHLRALKQPVLGICLGMQLLFERSEENDTECLGLLPGVVKQMVADGPRGITVPHMGWNRLERTGADSRLFDQALDGQQMYFVHSFQAPGGPWVRCQTDHGGPVVAAVEQGNFFGVQFHPERSGPAGAELLSRFVRL
jgi:imidazole glycerol-phosphate synthase subunit HisH